MNNKSSNAARTNILWHRRLGLSVFVVLIFLAITGFALNHSPGLKLNQIGLSSNWLLSWYGLETPEAVGFESQGHWIYHNSASELFFDSRSAANCSPPLAAVARHANMVFALCADALVMLSSRGEFIEQFSAIDGLPANIETLAVLDNKLYLATDSATLKFNPDSFMLMPVDFASQTLLAMQQAAPLPESLQAQLKEQSAGPSISLETVILDLHSGRFFGQFGVLFIDLVGLLVCVLSITGLIAWVNRR